MSNKGFGETCDAYPAMRKRSCDNQPRSSLDHSAEGFDIWWNRTFARHAAVVAQASALKRAYQRASSSDKAGNAQAH